MFRKHMTEAENERMKQKQRAFAHNGIRLEERYPQVECISINYIKEHTSFVSPSVKEGVWTVKPQSEAYFILECLNRECTSIGFDLSSAISSAIRNHESEVSGKMKCEGQEAPDHPEQSCSGTLKYTIRISYKE